jgi:hypothetical protein
VIEVAGLKGDGFALEAVMHLFRFTLQTEQANVLDLFARLAGTFCWLHVEEFMAFIAEDRSNSQSVAGNRMEVVFAISAQGNSALTVLNVNSCCLIASHTSLSWIIFSQDGLELMLVLAEVLINAQILALKTKFEITGGTILRTVLPSLT